MENGILETLRWLKWQNGSRKHKLASVIPKRQSGEAENGRNGRDNHPKVRAHAHAQRLEKGGAARLY